MKTRTRSPGLGVSHTVILQSQRIWPSSLSCCELKRPNASGSMNDPNESCSGNTRDVDAPNGNDSDNMKNT